MMFLQVSGNTFQRVDVAEQDYSILFRRYLLVVDEHVKNIKPTAVACHD